MNEAIIFFSGSHEWWSDCSRVSEPIHGQPGKVDTSWDERIGEGIRRQRNGPRN